MSLCVREVSSSANSLACPLTRGKKTLKNSRVGCSWALWVFFGIFWDLGHWKKMTLFSKRLATLSCYTLNSSRERIPVRCHCTATHSATFFSSHSHSYVPPGCHPVLRTPHPLLPTLFRLKESPKGLGHNGGKWKSTVFSFYLSFLGLIFCFLVVLISAICNSYI